MELTPEARRLLSILPATRREGASRLGVGDREFRKLVETVKGQGVPILSPTNGCDQYRQAETQEEVIQFIRQTSHRATALLKQVNACIKQYVPDGQMEIT